MTEVVEIDRNTLKVRSGEVYPCHVEVCIDETDWSVVDKATGEVVQEPGSRYVSTMTVAWQDESTGDPIEPGWYVFSRRDSSEPC